MGWLDRLRMPGIRRLTAPPQIDETLWGRVTSGLPFIAGLDKTSLRRLRELAEAFLRHKEFHGAGGFVITDEVALHVTVQAVLPLLHMPGTPRRLLAWYDDFVGIVMHPDEVVAQREIMDQDGIVHRYQEVVAGEAMEGGPVMLSWRDAAEACSSAERGYNVVIHEFVHKLDMRDGQSDGCPPLTGKAARRHWLSLMGREHAAFRQRVIEAERFSQPQPWLDGYGAQSVDEFFAVAAEAYFVQRERFAQEFPALLDLFDGFFRPRDASAP